MLALAALQVEFSLIAQLGLFLLIGVVMKNAILMIDVAMQIERERGVPPHVAIREAALLRLRPILMTTMAAMLGALPLVLGQGEGNEMRKPLGIAIVGGLMVSQVLTLYTTPVVYLYLDRLRTWSARRKQRRAGARPSRRASARRAGARRSHACDRSAGLRPRRYRDDVDGAWQRRMRAAKSFRNASRQRLTLFAPG